MYPKNEKAYVGSNNVKQGKPSTIIYIKRNKLKTQGLIDFHKKKKKKRRKWINQALEEAMEVGEKGTCSMRKVAKSLNIFSTFFKGKMHTKMDHFLKKQEFKKFHSTVLNFYFIFGITGSMVIKSIYPKKN
jgi:hypothetical protein